MTIEIATLIRAAGGKVVGKVRLQKMVYLIEQLGCPTGFPFEYHHYGPYSAELAEAVEDAEIFGDIEASSERRADGVPYVIYEAAEDDCLPTGPAGSWVQGARGRAALKTMQSHSATILELAATTHWLAVHERVSDWDRELVRRKGVKTESGRKEKAIQLLHELGLPPAA